MLGSISTSDMVVDMMEGKRAALRRSSEQSAVVLMEPIRRECGLRTTVVGGGDVNAAASILFFYPFRVRTATLCCFEEERNVVESDAVNTEATVQDEGKWGEKGDSAETI